MQLRDLGRLLIKIAGLAIIVYSLSYLPYSFARLISKETYPTIFPLLLMTGAPSAISLAAGLLMFWGAGRIVDRIFDPPAAMVNNPPNTLPHIEELMIVGLGIYVFTSGSAELIYYLGKTILFRDLTQQHGVYTSALTPENFGGFLASGARIAMGIGLIFWSRRIAKWRRHFHKA